MKPMDGDLGIWFLGLGIGLGIGIAFGSLITIILFKIGILAA